MPAHLNQLGNGCNREQHYQAREQIVDIMMMPECKLVRQRNKCSVSLKGEDGRVGDVGYSYRIDN